MSSISQPSCTNDQGVIVTIGIYVNGDRTAIVLPMGHPDPGISANLFCADAVDSFVSNAFPLLVACLSVDANISFCQAEGMTDGDVPSRQDFDPAAYPGTVAGHALPSNTGGLIVFYRDPSGSFTGRIRVGKNTIPGVPVSQIVGDLANGTLQDNLQAFADLLQNGVPSVGASGTNWYRYLATPKPRTPGTVLKATTSQEARGYLATQRRRFIPRA